MGNFLSGAQTRLTLNGGVWRAASFVKSSNWHAYRVLTPHSKEGHYAR